MAIVVMVKLSDFFSREFPLVLIAHCAIRPMHILTHNAPLKLPASLVEYVRIEVTVSRLE